MSRFVFLFCLTCLLALLACKGMAAEKPLRLGVVPFNSAIALFKTHQPLQQHLEAELKQPVVLYSSPDHLAFFQDAMKGAFDVIIISPHLGVVCIERGFVPLVRYQGDMLLAIVTRRGTIRQVGELQGKRVGFPDRMSVFSVVGQEWLENLGFQAGRDYHLSEWASHAALLIAVAHGQIDAGITNANTLFLNQLSKDISSKVTLVFPEKKIYLPHLMTLARKDMGDAKIAQILKVLQSFPKTAAGQNFFRETGYQGYVPIAPEDIQKMLPYINSFRKELLLFEGNTGGLP